MILATLALSLLVLAALAAPRRLLVAAGPVWSRRPRRYRGRHVAARRLVFALPVKVVAA